ncbi:Thioesterase/thiol ester dehydrase-isomerase, partial [Massarina eburnea CBS 473.64]
MYAIARSACRAGALGLGGGERSGAMALRRGFRDASTSRVRVLVDFESGSKSRISKACRRQFASTSARPAVQASPAGNPTGNAKKPIYIRLPTTLALTLLSFTLGFTIMAADTLPTLVSVARPPTDAETMTLYTPDTAELAAIESEMLSHPFTRALLQDDKFSASRPHLKIPEAMRHQSLTGGTLLGENKIAVPPLQFQTADGVHFVSVQHLGHALCGHPGIVHGGLLATLLDEGLGRCCFPALPNKVAVTASLKVDYKKPVMAGQMVVLRAETTRVEGRKAWVKGRLETLPKEGEEEGTVLVEAEALFIEPRQAATMKRV